MVAPFTEFAAYPGEIGRDYRLEIIDVGDTTIVIGRWVDDTYHVNETGYLIGFSADVLGGGQSVPYYESVYKRGERVMETLKFRTEEGVLQAQLPGTPWLSLLPVGESQADTPTSE